MNVADDHISNDVAGQQEEEETKKRRVPLGLETTSSRLSMTGEIDESGSNCYSNLPGVPVSQPGSMPEADAVNGRAPSFDDPGGAIQLETRALEEENGRGSEIISEQRPKENIADGGFEVVGTDAIVHERHGGKLIGCMMVLILAAFGGGVVTGIAVGKNSQDSIVERMTNLNNTEKPSSNPTFTPTGQPSEATSTSFPPTSLEPTTFPPTQAPSLRPSKTPSTPDPIETPTLE
jgi:hypothetical protein